MIELTTGVVFLVSSLYGGGQAANIQTTTPAMNASYEAAAADSSFTFKDDTKISTTTMEAYLRQEYADEPILVDIARCESEFRQFDSNGNVVRGRVDNADVGVMQINQRYHGDMAEKLGMDLLTVKGNVEYAKHLYAEQGLKPWSASKPCWGGSLAMK